MSSEYLLMGGQNGGKTTFTGALLYYLEYVSDLTEGVDYDIKYVYREDVVQEQIKDEMWPPAGNRYPKKTDASDPYIVKIYFYEGSLLPREISIEIMDIPGEKQEPAGASRSLFAGIKSLLPSVTTEQQELVQKYRDELKPKIESDMGMSISQWEDLFRYRYLRSDSVILMFNLYKMEHDDSVGDPKVLDEDWLDVASGKQRKLILVSACDVVDYEPETFDGGQPSILSGTVRDTDLVQQIRDSTVGGSKASRLLKQVTDADSDFSLLGVSVPAENPKLSDTIRTNGAGELDIRGFERVIQWLKQ